MDEKPYIALACGSYDDPVPVWNYDYAQLPPTRPAFASIGEQFLFWISLIDGGYMYWDAPSWYMRPQLPEDIANKLGGVPSD